MLAWWQEDAHDGEVFSCVVQLQLRAEEIQSQRQELELIRQRMVKLTGDGKTAGTLEVLAKHLISVRRGALPACLILSCPGVRLVAYR